MEYKHFKYVVVNQELDRAVSDLGALFLRRGIAEIDKWKPLGLY
jgi:guanylate kinase